MSTKYALLGLLVLKPRTGYALHKRLSQFSPLVEPISLRRIYPMLKRLHQEGLVVFVVEPQRGKPDRKVYHVTDEGEAEFLEWLRGPAPEADSITLMPFMLRFFFFGILDKQTLLFRLREVLAAREGMLAKHRDWPGFVPPDAARDVVDPQAVSYVWDLMLVCGRDELQLQVNWLKESISRVERDW